MSKPLPHEITGNESSEQLIVFLHGWPDTSATWNEVIPSLEKDLYILNVSYPNYSPEEYNPNGIDFEELTHRLKATIDLVNNSKRKIIVVGHDWGAGFTYYLDYLYPGYASEIVPIDVGPKYRNPILLIHFFILSFAFLIGGKIGKFITQTLMKCALYSPAWKSRVDSSWNYPYYYLLKRLIKAKGSVEKAILTGYKPSCNVVFIYGTRKPVRIFTSAWIETLSKNPRNEVHAVKAIHWVQNEQPEFLIDLIKRRARLIRDE